MYAIRQLAEGSVYCQAVVMSRQSSTVGPDELLLAVCGTRLIAFSLAGVDGGTNYAESESEPSPSQMSKRDEIGSVCIGSVPLVVVCTMHDSVFIITEDRDIVLLQVKVEAVHRPDDGENATASRAAASFEVRFDLMFHTPIPMDTVAATPPSLEGGARIPFAVTQSGGLIAFQLYRGWLHVVDIAKIFLMESTITKMQAFSILHLEKAVLHGIMFIETTESPRPIVVPIYERGLTTVRGYFLKNSETTKVPLAALADAARRWSLGSQPYRGWTLQGVWESTSAAPSSSSSARLVFAVKSSGTTNMVFSDGTRKIIVPLGGSKGGGDIVDGMEVVRTRDNVHLMFWVLDMVGTLRQTNAFALSEDALGDCEGPSFTDVRLGSELPKGTRPWTMLRDGPLLRESRAALLGDGYSVFVVDPLSLQILRLLHSDGPVVGICDGVRGSLVTLTPSGHIASYRQTPQPTLLGELPIEDVSAVYLWCPQPAKGALSVSRVYLLLSVANRSTQAFLMDIAAGEVHEVSAGSEDGDEESDGTLVAPFQASVETLLATYRAVTSSGAAYVALQATSQLVEWRSMSAAGQWSTTTLAHAVPPTSAHRLAHVACAPATPNIVAVALPSATSNGKSKVMLGSMELIRVTKDASLISIADVEEEVRAVALLETHTTLLSSGASHIPALSTTATVAFSTWNSFSIHIANYAVWSTPNQAMSYDHHVTVSSSIRVVELFSPLLSLTAKTSTQLWLTDASSGCYTVEVPTNHSGSPLTKSTGFGTDRQEAASTTQLRPARTFRHAALTKVFLIDSIGLNKQPDSDVVSTPEVCLVNGAEAEILFYTASSSTTNTDTTMDSVNASVSSSSERQVTKVDFTETLLLRTEDPELPTAGCMWRCRYGGETAASSAEDAPQHSVRESVAEEDSIMMITATPRAVHLWSTANAASMRRRKGTITGSLTASSSSSTMQKVHATHLPSILSPWDTATFLVHIDHGASRNDNNHDSHQAIVAVDTQSRGTMLSLVNLNTLQPVESMYLGANEIAIDVKAIPRSWLQDAVVVGTGICELAPPADPTKGRVLIVGTAPLTIRAAYAVAREPVYALSIMSSSKPLVFGTPTEAFSQRGSDTSTVHVAEDHCEESDVFVTVAFPSSIQVLKLLGDRLICVASAVTQVPATTMAASYPYVSISHFDWGSVIYRFETIVSQAKKKHQETASAKRSASLSSHATPIASAACDPSARQYRLVQQCVEAFAYSSTISETTYAKDRFARSCLQRNLQLVALEPQRPSPSGAAPPPDVEANGGSGITTSPVVPVCVASTRLPGRMVSSYVTTTSHAPLTFSIEQAQSATFSSLKRAVRRAKVSCSMEKELAGLRLGTDLRTWNFNRLYEPYFSIVSTTPRLFIGCDDGSVHIICGIPAELSRFLVRLENRIQQLLRQRALLQPRCPKLHATIGGGFAPCNNSATSPTDAEIDTFGARIDWVHGCRQSVVPFSYATATRSMSRWGVQHGLLHRDVVQALLQWPEALQRSLIEGDELLRKESSDPTNADDVRDLVTLLDLMN